MVLIADLTIERKRVSAPTAACRYGEPFCGRYEIQALTSKDRGTITLQGIDRHGNHPVTVRALIVRTQNSQERDDFLQDAEMAASLSAKINDPQSIRVVDYGQDGPIVFLIKAKQAQTAQQTSRPRIVTRIGSNIIQPASQINAPSTDSHKDTNKTNRRPQQHNYGCYTYTCTNARIPTYTCTASIKMSNPPPPPPGHTPTRPLQHISPPQQRIQTPLPVQRDWLREGNQAYEKGITKMHWPPYEIATQQNATLVDAWSGKGATLLLLDRAEEALLAYEHAIALRPNDPEIWTARGEHSARATAL